MKVIFDKSSFDYERDKAANEIKVYRKCEWLKKRFCFRGYLYASEIYDAFGASWNPHMNNVVYIKGENDISFTVEKHVDERRISYIISF